MKNWRQKLSIDWPCALGDWLWAMFVVEIARLLDKITRRRVLHVFGLVLLLMFFQQIAALHLTALFGVDLGLLMEMAAATFVLIARKQGAAAVTMVRHHLVLAKPRVMQAWRRGARRLRRAVQILLPPPDEDGRAAGWA